MALRNEYKDDVREEHGVKLGFMSFFVKACIAALKEIPAVNAEIDGDEIVYKNYYDIGVAVGTERGLVVPVVRDADQLSFAEIERRIDDFGLRARDGKLKLDELQGGTFTISNGGVYGSLLSTPILNPPQTGILGMHKIQKRPVAVDGKVVIRPMMYLALSYDHRLVDGREAVTFLVRVKEASKTRSGCCSNSENTGRMSELTTSSSSAAGPAATTRAIRAAQLGMHVACVEKRGTLRRHLPQRRLHPVQGAAARVASSTKRRKTTSPRFGIKTNGVEPRSRRR